MDAVAVDQSHFGTDRTIDQLSVGYSPNQGDTDNLANVVGHEPDSISSARSRTVGITGD